MELPDMKSWATLPVSSPQGDDDECAAADPLQAVLSVSLAVRVIYLPGNEMTRPTPAVVVMAGRPAGPGPPAGLLKISGDAGHAEVPTCPSIDQVPPGIVARATWPASC